MTAFSQRYGPWAVVTGAAQGVGRAFARSAAERGLSVVLVDRDPKVRATAADLPGSHRAVVADLTNHDWLDVVANETAGLEMGLVVANAGIAHVGPFLDQTPETADAIIDVSCRATVAMARWALPPMVARGRGAFLVTSSGSALAGTGGVATYSASKAFVLNLAEAIGWELRSTGVDVAAVVAPTMDTPGLRATEPVDERMAAPAVDPAQVTDRALDALPARGAIYGDEILATMESASRADLVDLMSAALTGMYPSRFG